MKKIGILDSGIGGLTLLHELIYARYEAEYFYISDNENVPYGEKSQDFMLKQMKLMVDELLKQSVEAIVIACNTATAETIDVLRSEYDIPFIGIEPYINFLNHTESKNMALILTRATFNSERFQRLKADIDKEEVIDIYPLENLAVTLEKLTHKSFEELRPQIDEELSFLKDNSYEYLILGCTHYPLISKYIEDTYKVKTINPNASVVKHLARTLELKQGNILHSFKQSQNLSSNWLDNTLENLNIFKYLK